MQAQPVPKMPPDDRAEVLALCNVVALHRFGVLADLMPVAQRAVLIDHIAELVAALDAEEFVS